MTSTLEEITSANFNTLLDLMADFNAIDGYPFYREKTEKNLAYFATNPEVGKAFFIFVDGHIAGYLILSYGFSFEHNGRYYFVDELYIKPEFRQKGLGNEAMQFVEKFAQQNGVQVIYLEVEKHNLGGLKLYNKMGYSDNGRILLNKKLGEL